MGLFDRNSTSTSNLTTNYDQRQVNTTTSSSYDLSNRSVDSSTTNNTSITNLTDGGAIAGMVTIVGKALDGAGASTMSAYNFADSIFDSATVFANRAQERAADVFADAASMTRDTLVSARQAYQESTGQVAKAYQVAQAATADAYADAKGTTNSQKQIILGVLAVAGLLALAAFSRKG
ncbi:MAG: hypothetical protein ACXW2U_00775 [Telluria sp.]